MSQQTLDITVSGIATPEREQFARFVPYFLYAEFSAGISFTACAYHTADGFLAEKI
jgi:hypothetical protein